MNRLVLVRHGGSTANEDKVFYTFPDSAICLTTNGIRQALETAEILGDARPEWRRTGDFTLEVFASQYTRTQQTGRIVLDQMSLPGVPLTIRATLNERDYGAVYDARMDSDPAFAGQGGESAAAARRRVRGFLAEIDPLLHRADVLAFSHFGTIRALWAELLGLTDSEMMSLDVQNGAAHSFLRSFGADCVSRFALEPLPPHVLHKAATKITPPPALTTAAPGS